MKKTKSFLIITKPVVLVNKLVCIGLILFSSNGYCCTSCNKQLQHAISESFYTNIFIMFSAFIVLTLIIIILIYFALRNSNFNSDSDTTVLSDKTNSIPLFAAAIVLGIGIGGFADGIILHQILQWHEMLSGKFPPNTLLQKSVNMFWDGIFHLFTLLTTVVGIYLLWSVMRKIKSNTSGSLLSGGMLAGWGIFNLVEGVINHQILEMHNVREATASKDLWNYGFLLFGIILLLSGWLLAKKNIFNFQKRNTINF